MAICAKDLSEACTCPMCPMSGLCPPSENRTCPLSNVSVQLQDVQTTSNTVGAMRLMTSTMLLSGRPPLKQLSRCPARPITIGAMCLMCPVSLRSTSSSTIEANPPTAPSSLLSRDNDQATFPLSMSPHSLLS